MEAFKSQQQKENTSCVVGGERRKERWKNLQNQAGESEGVLHQCFSSCVPQATSLRVCFSTGP